MLPLLGFLAAASVQGADVVGEIQLKQTGLFQAEATQHQGAVSVSLKPLEKQPWPRNPSQETHQMTLKDKQLRPSFLVVKPGDTVQISNQDPVFHELFALSATQPLSLHLNKAGNASDAQGALQINSEGTWHMFCRIHSRMYARIDAVSTPLTKMVQPGEIFRFSGLQTGLWQLRVAGLGAETRELQVMALTSPPPLKVDMQTKGGETRPSRSGMPVQGRVEQLYPRN